MKSLSSSAGKVLAQFLVGKMVDGHVLKVSDSGRVYSFDASLSFADGQQFGMTETDHENCCKAAKWMFRETIRPNFVDLEGGWRVSLF